MSDESDVNAAEAGSSVQQDETTTAEESSALVESTTAAEDTTTAGEETAADDTGAEDTGAEDTGAEDSAGEEDAEDDEEGDDDEDDDEDEEDDEDEDDDEDEEEFTDDDEEVPELTKPNSGAHEATHADPVVPLEAIGSVYRGEWQHGRMHGFGRYTFSNGNYFVGNMIDGQFEGEGTLFFPGKGKYVGVWKNGRAVSGDYIFADNLIYKEQDWQYCTDDKSRLFWSEIEHGQKPAGAEQLHNQHPAPKAPIGFFDVGQGWFDPNSKKIYGYDNQYLRTPDEEEITFILQRCRRVGGADARPPIQEAITA